MVRKRDPFWKYVEILANGRARCKFCAEEFAGGSSRIKSHLSRKKGGGIKICQKVPKVVQFKVLDAIGAQNIKVDNGIDNHNIEIVNVIRGHDTEVENETIPTSSSSSSKACETKKDTELVDKKLAKFILSNTNSHDATISPFFIDFVKDVANFGPHYKLPDEETLNGELIPYLERKIEKYYEDVKNLLPKSGCTIIFHKRIEWNVRFLSSYTISAYTPNGVLLLYKTDPSTSVICDWFNIISNQIDTIGDRHVIQFLTNDNTVSVRSSLINKYPWMNVVDSSAIEVIENLLVKISDEHGDILNCAELIVTFVRIRYPNDYFKGGLARIEKIDTCFLQFSDETIEMAVRFWKLKSLLEFENELQNLQVSTCCEDGDEKLIHRIMHCTEFWNDAKELVSILQPLFQAVTVASLVGPSIGYLFEILERAKAAISQCFDNNQDRYKDVLEWFNKARGEIIHPVHAAAAFLNPACMLAEHCKVNVEELKRGMQFISENLVPVDEKEAFNTQLQHYYLLKGSIMFTKVAMMSFKSIHPRTWWDKYGDCLPVLQKYAIRILSQPCNSSFFIDQPNFGNPSTKLKMMERFKVLEMQMSEAVDLDKLSGLEWIDQQKLKEELQDLNFFAVNLPLSLLEERYNLIID